MLLSPSYIGKAWEGRCMHVIEEEEEWEEEDDDKDEDSGEWE